MERAALIGDPMPVQFETGGITLLAPGLVGEVKCYTRQQALETRADPHADVLGEAIASADLAERGFLVIDAPTPAAGGVENVRGMGDDQVLLQIPAGTHERAFVLYEDESGVVSFHYSAETDHPQELPTRAGIHDHVEQIRIPLRHAAVARPGNDRGLFGDLAAKVLRVIIVNIFPDQVGRLAAAGIQAWERKHRASQGFHGGTAAQLLGVDPVGVPDLAACAGRRSLLFIHGTTSSTAGAFAGLSGQASLLERLYRAYEGRVIGFNHHTMSASVADNVRDFFDALPPADQPYPFDVVCHSRGGLLARALTQLPDAHIRKPDGSSWSRPAGARVSIERIVFVATPNAGTALAVEGRIPEFVDRLTSYLNLLPDSIGVISLSALLALAGAIARVGLPHVPGLLDQAPGSTLLEALGGVTQPGRFFAFEADYEPTGSLKGAVLDSAADRIFASAANDLVVPTEGVSTWPGMTIDRSRVHSFGRQGQVHHTNFFNHPRIDRMLEFLGISN